jgi:hypothetical protein
MAKRPTEQQTHSWAVYHIRGTPAQFVGIVYDQPDEQAAIKQAIEEFKVPANQRDRAGLIDRSPFEEKRSRWSHASGIV